MLQPLRLQLPTAVINCSGNETAARVDRKVNGREQACILQCRRVGQRTVGGIRVGLPSIADGARQRPEGKHTVGKQRLRRLLIEQGPGSGGVDVFRGRLEPDNSAAVRRVPDGAAEVRSKPNGYRARGDQRRIASAGPARTASGV